MEDAERAHDKSKAPKPERGRPSPREKGNRPVLTAPRLWFAVCARTIALPECLGTRVGIEVHFVLWLDISLVAARCISPCGDMEFVSSLVTDIKRHVKTSWYCGISKRG